MQVTETLSDGLKRGFTIMVPSADIETKRISRLQELASTMKLPGFRPGKVPLNLVRQRYGVAVQSEVIQDAIDTAIEQCLQDRGLRAATAPKIDIVRGEAESELEFKVELEILPQIDLPDFTQISLTRLKAVPDDSAIDTAIGNIAMRRRSLTDVTEVRGAEKGDVLTVDFIGRIDGEAFKDGSAKQALVEVGGAGFIPGFTEQMEGLKADETRHITVTFPEDYSGKEVAGKEAVFEITAHKVQTQALPAIDDSFASELGLDDLASLRRAVAEHMQRELDGSAHVRIKRQLLDDLAAKAQFEVPASMVQTEFDAIWKRVEADRESGKLDDDDQGKDESVLREEYRAIAERRVRLGLLLAEIGRTQNIQVMRDEMRRAIEAETMRYPGQERDIVNFYQKNPRAAETLRGPIFEEKIVSFILDQANVEEKIVSPQQLAELESDDSADDAKVTTDDNAEGAAV